MPQGTASKDSVSRQRTVLVYGDDPRFEIDAPLSPRLTHLIWHQTAKSALLSLLWTIAVDTADDKDVSITASRPGKSQEPVDTVSWWQPVSPSLGLIGTRRDSGPGSGSQPSNGCQPSIENPAGATRDGTNGTSFVARHERASTRPGCSAQPAATQRCTMK